MDQFDGGADYANVDTLFSLGETYLFCQLVELKEKAAGIEEDGGFLARKSFYDMYNEIRASVDLCHRDGTLKQAVADDPVRRRKAETRSTHELKKKKANGFK